MDPLFKEVGIYAALGQRYDAGRLGPRPVVPRGGRRPGPRGGHHRGGLDGLASRRPRRRTRRHGFPMIPFYIFYSMFGFQRTGDQIWALADARGRGFMMGATAGRTTLTGEGLQHDDGHSHILASTVPNVRAYDPAFAYELAAIVRDGIERMYHEGEDVFYYITPLQRELRPAEEGRRASTRGSSAASTGSREAPDLGPKAHGAARRLGLDPPAGGRGPRPARREGRDRRRDLLGAVVPAAAPRRARGRALEPAPSRRRRRACRTSRRSSGRTAGRSSPRPTG